MSFAYIVAGVVVLHFIIGIGYLIYKIQTAKPSIKDSDTEPKK